MNPYVSKNTLKKHLQICASFVVIVSALLPVYAEEGDSHTSHDGHQHEDHNHSKIEEQGFNFMLEPHQEHEHQDNDSTHAEHEHELKVTTDNHSIDDDNHEEHDHEEPELKFSKEVLKEFSIELRQVTSGDINQTLSLTGEVIVAPERMFHVIPRVSGAVTHVYKHLGETVNKGDVLATLSSRELAGAKAEYFSANGLMQLANINLKREHNLFKNKVSSKRSYLEAKQAQAEMSVKRQAAQQRLKAIGLSDASIGKAEQDLTSYELRAPSAGIIIEKHATLGEALQTDSRSFTIADLSKVWVNFTVYQKDLARIRLNQLITISSRFGIDNKPFRVLGHISWISPVIDEATRSATARVVIDNSQGYWRPGLFVSGSVSIAKTKAAIVIPLSALQTIEGKAIVFVEHEDGEFEPQEVQIGQEDHQQVEILSGLKQGQTYVSNNAFVLKAQSQKSSFGHGHSH